MRHRLLRKFNAVLLLVVIVTVSATGICRGQHGMGQSRDDAHCRQGEARSLYAVTDGCCPSSPVEEHSDENHCAASCYCQCHLPLFPEAVVINHSPEVTLLSLSDPVRFLPEVYLPKFVPPQNLA